MKAHTSSSPSIRRGGCFQFPSHFNSFMFCTDFINDISYFLSYPIFRNLNNKKNVLTKTIENMMCCGVNSIFVKIFQCAGFLTTINNRRFQLVFIKSFSRVAVPVPVYSINTLITAPGQCAGMKHGL